MPQKKTFTLTVAMNTNQKDLRAKFYFPLARFVKANGLGFIYDQEEDLEPGNIAEWGLSSPTDDPEDDGSVWVAFRIDGTGIIHDGNYDMKNAKIACEGSWLDVAKWIFNFYADIARKMENATEQLEKLEGAMALLHA